MPRLGNKSLVKANLELWLNNELIKSGFYTNVVVGETNSYGVDISALSPDIDESYSDNSVWQSAFKEWVYESGVACTISGVAAPIIASGIIVNGTFYSRDTTSPNYNATYDHVIDYRNGRIIFSSPINSNDVVQAAFSYKEVGIDDASSFENENNPLLIETHHKDNPQQSGVPVYPHKTHKTLPMIFIDILSRKHEPYELGQASPVTEFRGVLHVWTRDSFMMDLIEDFFGDKEHINILGIDFNNAPMPLDYNGDRNPSYLSYSTYADVWNTYFWHRIYLEEIDIENGRPLNNILRSKVKFKAVVNANF